MCSLIVKEKGPTDIVTAYTSAGCFVSAVPSKWESCGKCEGGEIYCFNASLKSKLWGQYLVLGFIAVCAKNLSHDYE